MTSPSTRDPRQQIAAGVYLAVWSVVGWWSAARTPELWAGDFGSDPGPGLLPMLVLTILSVGSLILVLSGLSRRIAERFATGSFGALLSGSLRPALLIVTLLVYVSAIDLAGFPVASAVFCFAWMLALGSISAGTVGRPELLQSIVGTAVGVSLIYFVFVYLIRVPL